MKVAIVSDIHGNLEAFKEVLSDIARSNVARIISVGDNVGYGPDPEEVVQLLKSRGIPSVMGNHELGLANPSYLNWFNDAARQSLILTKRLLQPETLNYLKHLPTSLVAYDSLFVHGCPPDSITTYLFEVPDPTLAGIISHLKQRISFVGHTHILQLITLKEGRITRRPLAQGIYKLDPDAKYVINVGSVGQPRDEHNAAKYAIWDIETDTLEVRFIPYDIAKTAEKILRLGFPAINAHRLW